jgi:hypothetical protein
MARYKGIAVALYWMYHLDSEGLQGECFSLKAFKTIQLEGGFIYIHLGWVQTSKVVINQLVIGV